MHYIQKHILDNLRNTQSVRYAKLNPENVESGHFRYHMRQLVQDGYVEQIERGLYGLNAKGQKLVDRLSVDRINPLSMPKVITYTLLKNDNSVMLQEKTKQPYIGLLNMVGGKVHEGETTQQASIREVKEKTGLEIDNAQLRGVFEVIINKDSELFTHVIAYIHTAEVNSTNPNLITIPISDLDRLDKLAPDFLPIFNIIKDTETIQTRTLEIDA